MAYYRTCPDCGDNLDPGERCECQDKRKTAPSGNDTQSGKAKQESDISHSFAISVPEREGDCQA